jgi:hypothetical protein
VSLLSSLCITNKQTSPISKKTIHKGAIYLFFLLLPVLLISGCLNRRSDDVISPDTGCRISKYTATVTATGTAQVRNEEAIYEYDQLGNPIKADSSWMEGGASAANAASSRTTARYTYNGDGFLTSASSTITMQTSLAGTLINAQRSSYAAFTYTNGRVTGYTTTYTTFGGLETTVAGTFEYDAAGNLVKRTAINTYAFDPEKVKEVPTYLNGRKRTWLYEDAQLRDYVEQDGATEVRPYIIVNGLLTRENRPDYFILYTYDAQEGQVKHECHSQGKVGYYYTQEWTDGKMALESIPAYKGFPQIPAAFGGQGILKGYEFYADIPGSGMSGLISQTISRPVCIPTVPNCLPGLSGIPKAQLQRQLYSLLTATA